ncbi:PhoH family protein [Psychrosphaera sp. B3R10]|uniref:PhoH family protein n=1 Tax=unclassified Psychrosphaera TaxID=2641570 RepID=UPI001C09CA58|nr:MULTISPECIES: PIN domain-containing protein [unclassified Psychrosphaera]MBU2880516.1 PhoH family protein [Psychrosphaera sp. I2R16]MBU2989608.1 PhoH family protein [Psychrosphaera sp. B3R10]
MPRTLESTQKKLFVLDTNILLHDPHAFFNFQEHDVLVPMTVLEELDHIKDRNKDVSRDARVAIRSLENILQDVTPEQMIEGVPLNRNELKDSSVTGHLIILNDHVIATEVSGLPGGVNDNKIINAALHLQKERSNVTVVLVTKDINMRLKAKGAGLKFVEDYTTDQLIDDVNLLTKGFEVVEGDFWQQVENVESEKDGRETTHKVTFKKTIPTFINEYILDEGEEFAARVTGHYEDKVELLDLGRQRLLSRKAWGITPKNIYQGMALNALMDPNIELVILTGPAGCGKTLLALASALEMVIELGIYDKVLVTRNTPEIAESIGFLPGTEEEKMAPWLAAITDSLEVLHKNDENPSSSLSYIMEKANVQFKSVNFMRGRSIQNAVVILQPRIENNLKFLLLYFYWPVAKVKRISQNMDSSNDFKHFHNSQPLQSSCYLRGEYNTKPSNDSILWEAA